MWASKGRDRGSADRDSGFYRSRKACRFGQADRDDKRCRDQIAIELATALVNAAYRAVAFTGSMLEPDRVLLCLGL
ncbi:hypothetical protein Taro_003166 [Colocasia esculenta]|uniref:Uncharacterized protein n=1 Tax=Colocasia esculenta TaxID=4460 RepID=A0A843TKT5_COLES|nr:hypothetical protein [Colocasia esculenta]